MCIAMPPNETKIAWKLAWEKARFVITAPEYAPGPKPSTRRSVPLKSLRSIRTVDVNREWGATK